MSKEEMIKAISKGVFPSGHENHSSYAKGYNSAIEETVELLNTLLDTYAQEIAVGFAEWIRKVYIDTPQGWLPRDNWCDPDKHGYYAKPNSKFFTTPQLFQQFLTNKNEKK